MPLPSPTASPSATAGAAAAYLPRDVVNAPEVKAAIARRSTERGDDADMAAWLRNHFFRWAIGSFEHVLPVRSVADYQAAAGTGMTGAGTGKPVPEWLARLLQPRTGAAARTCWYLDPDHLLLIERERVLVEFLRSRRGTRLEQKLQRINCFMALSMWEQEHQRMQARRNKGWVPSSGLALREVLRLSLIHI